MSGGSYTVPTPENADGVSKPAESSATGNKPERPLFKRGNAASSAKDGLGGSAMTHLKPTISSAIFRFRRSADAHEDSTFMRVAWGMVNAFFLARTFFSRLTEVYWASPVSTACLRTPKPVGRSRQPRASSDIKAQIFSPRMDAFYDR